MLKRFIDKVMASAGRSEPAKSVRPPRGMLRMETLESRITPSVASDDSTSGATLTVTHDEGETASLNPAPNAFINTVGVNDDGELGPQDARYLQQLLDKLAGTGLSSFQTAELETLVERFNDHGLEVEGEQQLAQLASLIGSLEKVSEKLGAESVLNNLGYINEMVENIVSGLEGVKNSEYEKFESLIGENRTREQARTTVEEAGAGFTQGWVEEHWLRYQIERVQARLGSASQSPVSPTEA